MRRLLAHWKANVVAYLALFVALGGTSYAAFELPPGSVGERQIKNRAIGPIKFASNQIGGYVRAWATVSADGRVLSSSGKVKLEQLGGSNLFILTWRIGFPRWCPVLATVNGDTSSGNAGFATGENEGSGTAQVTTVSMQGQRLPEPFHVAVIC